MRKIIGGLLVISLLSSPSLLRIDYIAYEICKASDQIIKGIRTIREQEAKTAQEISSADIDAAFDGIDRNSKSITKLLKNMNGVVGKMNDAMLKKSANRETMSEEQIETFAQFNSMYTDKTAVINDKLASISGVMGLSGLQNEIMSEDSDFSQIHAQLTEISDSQYEAINDINSIIAAAENTLGTLSDKRQEVI